MWIWWHICHIFILECLSGDGGEGSRLHQDEEAPPLASRHPGWHRLTAVATEGAVALPGCRGNIFPRHKMTTRAARGTNIHGKQSSARARRDSPRGPTRRCVTRVPSTCTSASHVFQRLPTTQTVTTRLTSCLFPPEGTSLRISLGASPQIFHFLFPPTRPEVGEGFCDKHEEAATIWKVELLRLFCGAAPPGFHGEERRRLLSPLWGHVSQVNKGCLRQITHLLLPLQTLSVQSERILLTHYLIHGLLFVFVW